MSIEAFTSIVGSQAIYTTPQAKEPFETSWRTGVRGNSACVLCPATTQQVSDIVKLCAEKQIPVIPQGGNTGVVDGAIPSDSGQDVILSLSRMNQIRNIDPENFTLTAEAGCILSNIQEAAESVDRLFPLSMASEGSCQLGGNIATNAGGTAVLRYGNTRDLILGLEVVLPNGEIIHGLRSLRKDNTGYDLKQLFIGSEGTLGVVTAAVVKLFPLPKHTETALLAIPDVHAAAILLSMFKDVMADGLTTFELMADNATSLVVKHLPDIRPLFVNSHPYSLLVEVSAGQRSEGLRQRFETVLANAMEKGLVEDGILAESIEHAKQWWHIREHIAEAIKREGKGIFFDVSVPISSVARFIEKTNQALLNECPELRIAPFGHMGDGNIHYNMTLPADILEEAFLAKRKIIQDIVFEAIASFEGSISAEHGVGTYRKEEFHRYKSAIEISTMRAVKQAIDPKAIFNPGKIL